MMTITTNKSAEGLVSYHTNSLSIDDYFFADANVEGYWAGHLREELGLPNVITKKAFAALARNRHPMTGKKLTPRQSKDRRASIEFTFSAPKSVSLVLALTKDKEILNAHRNAVRKAMKAIERDMHIKTRINGRTTYIPSGNVLYGRFDHFTSRPVEVSDEGRKQFAPDPNLHSHCVTMNLSKHNGRFLALEVGVVYRTAEYYQNLYHSYLSKGLQDVGYNIVRTQNNYEIKCISRAVINKFSNRTLQIEKEAKRLGITNAKTKGGLGAKTRVSKSKLTPNVNLEKIWRSRLTKSELEKIETAKNQYPQAPPNPMTPELAVQRSMEHTFQRQSTLPVKKVLAHAMKLSYGVHTPKELHKALRTRHDVIYAKKHYLSYMTTVDMVKQEDRMIQAVSQGKGKLAPINPSYQISRDYLNNQQRAAIHHVLNSQNKIDVITGSAGVGKTTTLIELKDGIEAGGKQIIALAPSANASRGVLRQKGFESANTIARFLKDKELQSKARGNVILVDEASLCGIKTMNNIFDTARKLNARVLLSGDPAQHSSPEQGDALRLILEKSKINPARIDKVLRQKHPDLKQTVELLAKGKSKEAFSRLEKSGAVIEIDDHTERYQKLAQDYADRISTKNSVLVIAPTHVEGKVLTKSIRQEMKNRGRISKEETPFVQHQSLNFTESQKQDVAQYDKGLVVQFHQNTPGGMKAGERFEVLSSTVKKGVRIKSQSTGKTISLPLKFHERFQVFKTGQLNLAKGDVIRLTGNGKTLESTRIYNGQIFQIKELTKDGHLCLSSGKTLSKDFAHLSYGYVQTSHAAQGKDANDVLIAQGTMSLPAINAKSLYVSVSRAKREVRIYTDDIKSLHQTVTRSGERMSAREIADRQRFRNYTRQLFYSKTIQKLKDGKIKQRQPDRSFSRPDKDRA